MIFPVIDKKIKEAFSSSAMQYDILASLQREIGRELTGKIEYLENSNILDVGMGTGWLTNRLNTFFPDCSIVGIDFAHGMIDHAVNKYENLTAIQADAIKLPFKDDTFEIVASNLAYQWIFDHSSAFDSCYKVMKDQGKLYITMFGYKTLQELFASIQEALISSDRKEDIRFNRLSDETDVYKSLTKAGFKKIEIKNEIIKSHFPNMLSVVKWIKDIGANAIQRDFYIGRNLLCKADEIYNEKFKDRLGVYATFEVLWVEAQK